MSQPDAPHAARRGLAGTILAAAGLAYVGLGAVLGLVWLVGEARTSLFPTGWLLPVVLATSGLLMVARRRFDLVGVLWAGLVLAVFQLDLAVYADATALGVENPAAFDATILAALLGLVPLILRPGFRP